MRIKIKINNLNCIRYNIQSSCSVHSQRCRLCSKQHSSALCPSHAYRFHVCTVQCAYARAASATPSNWFALIFFFFVFLHSLSLCVLRTGAFAIRRTVCIMAARMCSHGWHICIVLCAALIRPSYFVVLPFARRSLYDTRIMETCPVSRTKRRNRWTMNSHQMHL